MVDAVSTNTEIGSLNPYLYKLEYKPKPVLSHELGAGSPCLKCQCPGLDLHFWRKICKNCHCRLDEHVISPNDQDHGEIVIRKLFANTQRENFARYGRDQQTNSGKENSAYDGIAKKLRHVNLNKNEEHKDSGHRSEGFNLAGEQNTIASDQRNAACNKSKILTSKEFGTSSSNGENLVFNRTANNNNNLKPMPPVDPPQNPNGTYASSSSSSTTAGSAEHEPSHVEYTWMPAGEHIIVDKYMHSLPVYERPIIGTEGAQLRRQRLAYQLPYHDCDVEAAHSLKSDVERTSHQNFVEYVKQNAVGIGEIIDYGKYRQNLISATQDAEAQTSGPEPCKNCDKCIGYTDVGVITDHGQPNEVWHPGCFRCDICHQLLVDMLYFFKDGQYFCGRHYGEKVYPRCSGCDELIFAKEYTYAEEKSWHVDHFCCFAKRINLIALSVTWPSLLEHVCTANPKLRRLTAEFRTKISIGTPIRLVSNVRIARNR
ncbi:PET domain-containing protein [Ditylenchus destructor]|nr:PET domain-containing protein [Ditylenchus destructor]